MFVNVSSYHYPEFCNSRLDFLPSEWRGNAGNDFDTFVFVIICADQTVIRKQIKHLRDKDGVCVKRQAEDFMGLFR